MPLADVITRSLCLTAALGAVLLAATPSDAAPRATLSPSLPAILSHISLPLMAKPAPERRMHLAIALPLRDPAGLDALLRDIYTPASAHFRLYISVAEFADRFGPSAADYQKALDFFRDSGLVIRGISANRLLIDVEGAVADIERVFHVTMGLYQHPTEHRLFLAPDREPSLDLSVPVNEIIGLDDFVRPAPRLRHAEAGHEQRATGSGPGGQFLGSDVRTAYYGRTELTGAGQSVGLMELAGYNQSDIDTYFATVRQALTVPVIGISTDGSKLNCPKGCDDTEQVLDVEYAISMAPGLKQVQVYVAHSPESVMSRMASDNTSKQLSTSWGWGAQFKTDETLMKEMAVQGQSYLTASGDYSSLQASGPWPEEDPFITAVGGTDLATFGPGGAWRFETGWLGSAGGPSLDPRNGIQFYQVPFINPANGGSTVRRNVPDIAGDANTDNFICYDGTCGGGWGGTSFASPLWAGFIALVNEEAAARGKPPVGFLNPALYAIGSSIQYSSTYHDETRGRSGVFNSVYGYDLVTGLGSPHGQILIDSLADGRFD
jgi:subtilase family serine protease